MGEISILVVEDEGIVAENLADKLEQLGYAVAGVAAQGTEAVEMALRLRPRLILMDIQLEGAMDGIQAAEEIQRVYDVPVIYLTAHSDPATLNRAKVTGAFGYILKPFEIRDLATQIELALYKHRTDRQLSERREGLLASEERYRQLLGVMPAAMYTCDAEGRITYYNELAAKIWDRAPRLGDLEERFTGALRFRRPDGTELPPGETAMAAVLRSGNRVRGEEVIVERSDGSRVWVSLNIDPLRDEDGRITGAINVFTDISERRRARQELFHQQELLRKVLENIPVLLVIWDSRLRQFVLNRYAEAVLGWTSADAEEGDFMSKVYPDAAYRAEVSAYMQGLEPGWREWRVATRDGREIPIRWANIRLSDDTRIGIGVDLRDRK